MDRIAPPRPPDKERAIPPPDESRGHLGAVLVTITILSNIKPRQEFVHYAIHQRYCDYHEPHS